MKKTKAKIAADNYINSNEKQYFALTPIIKVVGSAVEHGYNTATLKWRKIDPNNLPKVEVLARNGKYTEIGILIKTEERGAVLYNKPLNVYWDCTHYILVSDLLQLPKED